VLELTRDAPLDPCYCVMFSYAAGREPATDEPAEWFPELGAITAAASARQVVDTAVLVPAAALGREHDAR
jgi:hypothetical protein